MAKEHLRVNNDIISERIHDADSETNENVLHWLQLFIEGKISQKVLTEKFNLAYEKEEHVLPPWHEED
jgi:hypothetical protein